MNLKLECFIFVFFLFLEDFKVKNSLISKKLTFLNVEACGKHSDRPCVSITVNL